MDSRQKLRLAQMLAGQMDEDQPQAVRDGVDGSLTFDLVLQTGGEDILVRLAGRPRAKAHIDQLYGMLTKWREEQDLLSGGVSGARLQ